MKRTVITIKVPDLLKKVLLKLAADDNRSLSNYILNAVIIYLRDREGIKDWEKAAKKDF